MMKLMGRKQKFLVSAVALALFAGAALSAGIEYTKASPTLAYGFRSMTMGETNEFIITNGTHAATSGEKISTILEITSLDCTPTQRNTVVKGNFFKNGEKLSPPDDSSSLGQAVYFISLSKETSTSFNTHTLNLSTETGFPAADAGWCWSSVQKALLSNTTFDYWATRNAGSVSCGRRLEGCGGKLAVDCGAYDESEWYGGLLFDMCQACFSKLSCKNGEYCMDSVTAERCTYSAGNCNNFPSDSGWGECCPWQYGEKGGKKYCCPPTQPVYDATNNACCPTGTTTYNGIGGTCN